MKSKKKVLIFTVSALVIYIIAYYLTDVLKLQFYNFDKNNWDNPLESTSGIEDNPYMYDHRGKIEEIYITIANIESDNDIELNSFKELLYLDEATFKKYKTEAYFTDGKIDVSIFKEANAGIEAKGDDVQKSFKIRLYDNAGLWNGQNIINLHKDYSDSLRIRNKLTFDYFSIIPDVTSWNTRFVKLFIKDIGEEDFSEYGLFTHVEQPNKLALKNHRFNPNANMYKAETFNFSLYPENIKINTSKDYSKNSFEMVLEILGEEDHAKLIEMLDSVNNIDTDINLILSKYFDTENYFTWLAANILMDHFKTSDTNFILYSPINSPKWYFMPWDCDQAWGFEKERPSWQLGLSAYWSNVLHRRVFEEKENLELLNKKIEELSQQIITPDQTQIFLDNYYNGVLSSITSLPDIKYLPVTIDNYLRQYKELPMLTEKNKSMYYAQLEKPMPFNLNEVAIKNNSLLFSWEEAYDMQNDTITYNFELSKDKEFSTSIHSAKNLIENSYTLDKLSKGIYYWRVTAYDSNLNSQIPFDTYIDPFGDPFFGIRQLIIE